MSAVVREDQGTIEDWRAATFGGTPTPERAAERAWEEMAEFALSCDISIMANADRVVTNSETIREAANVVIALYAFAEAAGEDLDAEVARKMAINRARKWESAGDGTGYHVDGEES